MTIITPAMEKLVKAMRFHADTGFYHGSWEDAQSLYFNRAIRTHHPSGTRLIFTRDIGMHACGWFKNPDYDNCFHLSLSFHDVETREPAPFNRKLAQIWVGLFYGDAARLVWEEGASLNQQAYDQLAPEAKVRLRDVRHFRVFCDLGWQPIMPRKEVYTRDFIELGWQSWSDQQYERNKK